MCGHNGVSVVWFSFYCLCQMLKKFFGFVRIIRKENDNFDLALRKRLFCIAKQPLLPCKTYAFTMQNNRFCIVLIMRVLCNRYSCEKIFTDLWVVFSLVVSLFNVPQVYDNVLVQSLNFLLYVVWEIAEEVYIGEFFKLFYVYNIRFKR